MSYKRNQKQSSGSVKKRKLNAVDFVIIFAVCAAVFGAYWRFGSSQGKVVSSNEAFQYVLEIKTIKQESVDFLEKAVGTEFVIDEKGRDDAMGKLVSYSVSEAKNYISMADGSVVYADIPDRFDALLTFEINGKINERGFFTDKLKIIGVDSDITLLGKWITVQGKVVKIARK